MSLIYFAQIWKGRLLPSAHPPRPFFSQSVRKNAFPKTVPSVGAVHRERGGGGWRAAPSAVVQPLQLHAGVRDVRVDEVEARQLHRDGPASGVYGCQVGGCLPRPRMGVGWWLTAPRPPKGFGDSRTALPGPPPGASPPCRGPPAGNKLPERRVVRILQI